VAAADEILEKALDRAMWRRICPWLTVESEAPPPERHAIDLDLTARMIREGYVQLADVIPPDVCGRLAAGVIALRQRSIPPIFVFAYDQYWHLTRHFAPLLHHLLGDDHRMLPNVWTWYVDTSAADGGWAPHRDRKFDTLLPDGMPKAVSVWVPLTDAHPLNGCMYCVPAYLDEDYRNRNFSQLRCALHDARALPAKAGSILCWSQGLAHWGGRSSDRAPHPRISLGFEFQRGDVDAYDSPLVRQVPPSFEGRLALIGKMIYLYWSRSKLAPPYIEVAMHQGQRLAELA
jgi:hypothetical protein